MRTIYIDSEYRCHLVNNGNMTPIETEVFDGKCDIYIEGYRFIPNNHKWIREDGEVFYGEMVAPWKDDFELFTAQYEYEQQVMQEYKNKDEELNISYNEGINSI